MNARTLTTLHLSALVALTACGGGGNGSSQSPNVFRVEKDDLPIAVRENAELQALRETVVRSAVEGQATIIYIIPEGTHVKQGERLVELDVSELVEKRANQAISVAKADAALIQARKEKEILQKELITKHNTAESNLRIAEMELEKLLGRRATAKSSEGKNRDMLLKLQELVETPPQEPLPAEATGERGEGAPVAALTTQVDPRNYRNLIDKVYELLAVDGDVQGAMARDMGNMANQILQQADQIRIAMADLKVKEEYYSYSRRLAQKQFITRNELDKDKLAWQSQVSKVTLAWNDLDLLINYTLARERIKLTQDRDNASLELERVKGSNDAAVTKADSELESRQAEFALAKERLENLDRQIKSGVIFAPTPGTVVYARIDRNRGGGEAVREGIQVRDRQELIILPDTTKMRCVVKVQEAQVDKVMRGQPAFVSVEAFQGETFTGRVTNVAPVADSNSGWMTSDRKVYTTVVELDSDNPDGRLRSRMAANVTIMVETIKDTLPVPLTAVFRDRSVNYVWKQTSGRPMAVPVQVGRQNSERVEILAGVAPGDLLLLTAPAEAQEPKFEQPVAPTPTPFKEPAADAAPAPTGDDTQRPQRRPGSGMGSGAGAMSRKKLVDMTAEELTQFKDGLGNMEAMFERLRERMTEEQVQAYETNLGTLKTKLDAGSLDEAQSALDAMRAAMPRRSPNQGPNQGAGQPGGQGGGENGGRPGRGN